MLILKGCHFYDNLHEIKSQEIISNVNANLVSESKIWFGLFLLSSN